MDSTLPLPLLFLPSLGFGELGIILLLVLLLFGPGKLPQVAKSLGDSLRQFRSASSGDNDDKTKKEPDKAEPDKPVDDTGNTPSA